MSKNTKGDLVYKSTKEIRTLFVDYFKEREHTHVPSASLVPAGDPTLLFTNSGMVPFKDNFLGTKKSAYDRAVSAQRCVRAGGKHNDLENVGYTARHHTFFEMLGNFSFGDYFKQQAIAFAWEFIIEKLQLPADKLWITIHHSDKEAAQIWHKEIGIPKNRILALDEDNFWQMGSTGPCGPCSEIYYDYGPSVAGDLPGGPNEGDRYIEIWNLVFMQYEKAINGTMTPLPKPSVDTGMGLERIAAVLQGVHNNYDIDLFASILNRINELGGDTDGSDNISSKKNSNNESTLASKRIIADHIRSSAFLIADGVTPSNEGRGYVLRRIIRRALRHGNKLRMPENFFNKLVAPLVQEMGEAHPLIQEQQQQVEAVLSLEEDKFSQTLDQGLALLNKEKSNISSGVLDGATVFKLYDTYGFPADLTEDIGREEGFRVDWDGFNHAMDEQRKRSRAYSMFQKQGYSLPKNISPSKFVGYEDTEVSGKILAMLDAQGASTKELKQGDEGVIILDETTFYAESGGQVGDTGQIFSGESIFAVADTQKQDGIFLHFGKVEEGSLKTSTTAIARIDTDRRDSIAKHHSATHLLHAALHNILGDHAQQRGSRVADDSLRLDFAHNHAMTDEQLQQVEDWINHSIRAGIKIETSNKSLDAAKKEGAMALFGEKYGDKVRVVDIGTDSKELCGGTHCHSTQDIQEFVLLKENSISTGIRRIEGIVADRAQDKRHRQRQALNSIKNLLGTSDENQFAPRIKELIIRADKHEKESQQMLQAKQLDANIQHIEKQMANIHKHGKAPLFYMILDDVMPAVLNQLADVCRTKMPSGLIVLANKQTDKTALLVTSSKDLSEEYPADKLMQHLIEQLGGSGGGNAKRAQGGGNSSPQLDKIISGSSEWASTRDAAV